LGGFVINLEAESEHSEENRGGVKCLGKMTKNSNGISFLVPMELGGLEGTRKVIQKFALKYK
jgi:hypothetical protein